MLRSSARSRSLLVFTILLVCTGYLGAQEVRNREMVPDGKGGGVLGQAKPGGSLKTNNCPNGICYHGGAIMPSTPNVYYIWYGTWDGSGANGTNSNSDSPNTVSLLDGFINNLGGSGYENINATYYDTVTGAQRFVTGLLAHNTTDFSDHYSLGSALSDSGVQTVVFNAIKNGFGPAGGDANGVYFVLTSSDVNETSGFCTQYCGWHNHASNGTRDIKYAFVGNPDRCPTACEAQTTSPNNDSGGDGMANIIAHEQEEAISDPDLNAWFDRRGFENADKCAWTFGTESTASNGSAYNITLANVQYLIQQNWVNASGGFCAMSH